MTRATIDVGGKLTRMGEKLDDPAPLLKAVGVILVSESQRAFKAQMFGTRTWPARAPVNVYGLLADFAAGKRTPPARRFERRPALRDTGRLASSIAWQLVGSAVVEVGSNVEYASVHQFGGRIESVPITDAVRTALWSWLKSTDRSMRARLGWLLNSKFRNKRLTGKVAARPFVGITPRARELVKLSVGVNIAEAR